MIFTDDDLNRFRNRARAYKEKGEPCEMFRVDDVMALLARLDAAEAIIEFSGGPENDAWLEAENKWRKAAGRI